MSRYIDEEWLEDNAKEYSLGYYEEDEWATPLSILDSAPSIDIIRCKECKHWHVRDGLTYCDRIDYGYGYRSNDFCSRGERR